MYGRRIKLSFGSSLTLLLLEVTAAAVVAALLQCAAAKTTHVVGDSLGWNITPDPLTYSNWASSQTFVVGDVLEFNFITGVHDVAEVSKASFDACDGTNIIGSLIETGPAKITLSSPGEHYFICTVIGHCSFGQKLAIKVTGAASGHVNSPVEAPPSASPVIAKPPEVSSPPSPTNTVSATTPAPSIASIPPNPLAVTPPSPPLEAPVPTNPLRRIISPPSISPSSSSSGLTPMSNSPVPATPPSPALAPGPARPEDGVASPPYMNLSPTLAPSLAPGPPKPEDGVASPPSMNLSPTLAPTIAPGPAEPLNGMASPPLSVSPSSPISAPSMSRSTVTYLVGDSLGWTIPLSGPISYVSWANGKNFMVGDTLLFYFTYGDHDVAEVSKAGFDACDSSSTIGPVLNTSPAKITLKSPGQHFFICTFIEHCSFGQKLAINVSTEPSAASPPNLYRALPPSVIFHSPTSSPPAPIAISPSNALSPSTLTNPVPPPSVAATPSTLGPSPSNTPPPLASPYSSTPPETSPTSAASPPLPNTSSPALAPTHFRPPESHTVGDSSGWVIGGPSFYANWASHRSIAVGDTLLFNFVTGQHDVVEVTKSGFDDCSKANASFIGSRISSSPANITLKTPGQHYFICSFPGHCQAGQKLAVTVTALRTTYPSENQTSIAVSPSLLATAPMSSSASSLAIVDFSITLLTIFGSFFL